jgi:hypothetical protein
MKSILKKSVLALLLGMTAVSSFASTPVLYWEKTNYGSQYSQYSGTRVGGWNLSGATVNQTVFSGRVMQCPVSPGVIDCNQSYSQAISYMWTYATTVTYKQTIVPAVADLSVAVAFTVGKTRAYTDTFGIRINPGYKSQHLEVVPRRIGSATVYGVRVATGRTKTVRKCRICVQKWTEYEYYNEPNKIATVMTGNANASSSRLPETTYRVTAL